MAKKIIVSKPQEASKVLKRANIEHVLVEYPGETPDYKGLKNYVRRFYKVEV